MTVEPARHTTWLLEAFLKAGQLAGYSLHDPNSFEASDGFGQQNSDSDRVWVGFGYQKCWVFGRFWLPEYITIDGFGQQKSGSSNKNARFSPRFWVFGYPNPSLFEGGNGRQESFSPYLFNIKDGKRWTTADAYLRPAIATRENLNVALNVHVRKLIFNSEKKVTGVEFTQNSGYTIMEVST